jgi:hypothetical protein
VGVNRGPRLGDVRVRTAFAFFPVKIGFFRVWLEHYYEVEKCYHVYGALGGRWVSQSLFFDRESALDYMKEHYDRFVYLKRRDIFRDVMGTQAKSPWYQDMPPD